jgi:hypothetical protein
VTTPLLWLKRLFTTPLWTETADHRRLRRLRTTFGVPFAALAGLVWGFYAAPSMAVGSALFWSSMGAAAMAVFAYVERALVPPLAQMMVSQRRVGIYGLVIAETALVGGAILLFTRVMGVPYVPAVETALVFGAAYSSFVELLIVGDFVDRVVSAVRGGGLGMRRSPVAADHARASALLHSGQVEEAVETFDRTIRAQPRVASSYMKLARLRLQQRNYEAAVDVLERCLSRADLEPQQEGFVVRQIYDICLDRLDDEARAVDHVRSLLERQPDGAYALWAASRLRVNESGAPDDVPHDDHAVWAELDALPFELETERRFTVGEDFQVPAALLLDEVERVERGRLVESSGSRDASGPTPERETIADADKLAPDPDGDPRWSGRS